MKKLLNSQYYESKRLELNARDRTRTAVKVKAEKDRQAKQAREHHRLVLEGIRSGKERVEFTNMDEYIRSLDHPDKKDATELLKNNSA